MTEKAAEPKAATHENPRNIPGLPLQHQLKIPEFDWYLGPMYKRYEEILIERSKENRVVTVEKRRAPEIKPPPWEKHVKPRYPKWKFNRSEFIEKAVLSARSSMDKTQPEGTPRSHTHTGPARTDFYGSRDCGWFRSGAEQASVHIASVRKSPMSTPRRPSATPPPGAYGTPRWP
eukprot:gnl/MRDRNA2_/MRDRNA2_45532_c0_seq1.p1 gnl/MRDRNA2_/MRDRNA2_45532_c0~~gnl/MRDRNA2_/MRDRNA2_45532_c0_seq1.p1  ORF type:complete len:175 (-),score=32.45 gnl/MRDRNA2_/MRDRNA2_45532_c0_seq1:115-639(-)